MPWETSRRRKDPPGWSKIRTAVLTRANGMCEHTHLEESPQGSTTLRCTYPAQDVDHIVNVANGGSNSLDNLQALCDWHHKRKTQTEAQAARKAKGIQTERRATPRHPGLLD